MNEFQVKLDDMAELFKRGVIKDGKDVELKVALITAMDSEGVSYSLAQWNSHSSRPPENMPKEYAAGFERAYLDSPIVHQCMRLPLKNENCLKAAVHQLYSRVKELEEEALDRALNKPNSIGQVQLSLPSKKEK